MAEDKANKRTQMAIKSIEDAVFSILEEKDFEQITARDIYSKASVNKMTFYKYYKNKYDALAKAFVSRVNDEYAELFPNWESYYSLKDLDEANYQDLMFLVNFVERYRLQFSHLISNNGDFPKDVVFSALFSNYRPVFDEFVGNKLGSESEYLLHFAFGSYRSIYECLMGQIAKNPNDPFPREDAEKACRIIAKSFSAAINACVESYGTDGLLFNGDDSTHGS